MAFPPASSGLPGAEPRRPPEGLLAELARQYAMPYPHGPLLLSTVRAVRAAGGTWPEIGAALGVDPRTLRNQFAKPTR